MLRSYCFDILSRVLLWIYRNNSTNPAGSESMHFVAAARRSREIFLILQFYEQNKGCRKTLFFNPLFTIPDKWGFSLRCNRLVRAETVVING